MLAFWAATICSAVNMYLAPVEGFKGQLKAASRTPRCLDAVVFVRFAALQHGSNYRD
jgi:hypothetical protein